MEILQKLRHFQLVSKILTDLESHLGLSEKDLAEYIISVSAECKDAKDFHEALTSDEVEFPAQLSETLFKRIRLMMSKKTYDDMTQMY